MQTCAPGGQAEWHSPSSVVQISEGAQVLLEKQVVPGFVFAADELEDAEEAGMLPAAFRSQCGVFGQPLTSCPFVGTECHPDGQVTKVAVLQSMQSSAHGPPVPFARPSSHRSGDSTMPLPQKEAVGTGVIGSVVSVGGIVVLLSGGMTSPYFPPVEPSPGFVPLPGAGCGTAGTTEDAGTGILWAHCAMEAHVSP
jgi:hypothetical protein